MGKKILLITAILFLFLTVWGLGSSSSSETETNPSLLQGIILGTVQGLTEFLPVSSSGHLVLAEKILGVKTKGLGLEVLVHLGTWLAVLLYFRRKIWEIIRAFIYPQKRDQENRRLLLYLILGSIPAGIIGLLLRNSIEKIFHNPYLVCGMLLITGFILFSTKFAKQRGATLSPTNSLLIGTAQALAILPGISRSGTTISFGLLLGIAGEKSAEFSFLLAVIAILGANLLELKELNQLPASYIIAALFSLGSGYLAIAFLLRLIRKGKLWGFSYYCWGVGILGLIALGIRH